VSHFKFDGESVNVETLCHSVLDAIAVKVVSPLVEQRRLAIQIHFPYGTGDEETADWDHPDAHGTTLVRVDSQDADFFRKLDNDTYSAAARWSEGATLTRLSEHQFEIVAVPEASPRIPMVAPREPALTPRGEGESSSGCFG
jgi:hypothetical protein